MGAVLVAVNVVHELVPGYFHDSAIDKRPVDGPVQVTALGVSGDRQIDRSHGGPDKAVYAYAEEDARWWAAELGREIPSGTFGENLRTRGLEVSRAVIGERWRIGDALFEVRMPRTPCENLSARMAIDRFHVRFHDSGRVGAMLKVLETGEVAAGDEVVVVCRPDHDVAVADLTARPDPGQLRRMLDSDVVLARSVRAKARRIIQRTSRLSSGS